MDALTLLEKALSCENRIELNQAKIKQELQKFLSAHKAVRKSNYCESAIIVILKNGEKYTIECAVSTFQVLSFSDCISIKKEIFNPDGKNYHDKYKMKKCTVSDLRKSLTCMASEIE